MLSQSYLLLVYGNLLCVILDLTTVRSPDAHSEPIPPAPRVYHRTSHFALAHVILIMRPLRPGPYGVTAAVPYGSGRGKGKDKQHILP